MEMIDSNLFNQLKQKFSIKRNNAIYLCEQNKQKALENGKYYYLERQKKQLVFEKGKLLFENKDTKKIDEKLNKIDLEQQKILKEIGISTSALTPHFECDKCEDSGFVDNKMCTCFKKEYCNYLMKNSHINFENIPSINNYETSIFTGSQKLQIEAIIKNIKEFVNNFESLKIKNIVFTGSTGVGKTYLSQSIAKSLIEKGYSCLFISAFNLNNTFLKMHTSPNEDKLLLLNSLLNPDLLIIDDLGTEPILKNVTKEYLQLLLNERSLNNKATIITTNLMPNEIIDTYNERIFSRLFNKSNSALYLLSGEDLRIKK